MCSKSFIFCVSIFIMIYFVDMCHDLLCQNSSWSIASTLIRIFCVNSYHDAQTELATTFVYFHILKSGYGVHCHSATVHCAACSLSLVTKALWSEVVNLATPSQSSWSSSVCWSLWGRQWRGARVPDIARDWQILSKLVLCTESSHFLFCDTFLISLLWPILFFTPGVDGLVVVGQILVAVIVVKCRLRWKLLGENVWHIWLLSDVAWSAWNYWGKWCWYLVPVVAVVEMVAEAHLAFELLFFFSF